MTITLTPVISATEFIIQAKYSKMEGLNLCSKLIEWVSEPTHSNYHEAVTLIFFLAQTLRKKDVISAEELHTVSQKAANAIGDSKINRVVAHYLQVERFEMKTLDGETECPVDEINLQLLEFRKNPTSVKDDGVNLFERLIQWLSIYQGEEDHLTFMASTTTIFSIALELLSKGFITPTEKTIMFNRAFQVIVKYPDRKIENEDLVDFLESRGFEIKN